LQITCFVVPDPNHLILLLQAWVLALHIDEGKGHVLLAELLA
jgi:hypothetical protein